MAQRDPTAPHDPPPVPARPAAGDTDAAELAATVFDRPGRIDAPRESARSAHNQVDRELDTTIAAPQTSTPAGTPGSALAIGPRDLDATLAATEALRSATPSLDATLASDGAPDPVAAASTRTPGADPGAPSPFTRGMTLGRYVLLDPLGAGGMGMVFAAYDPDLQRRVAVKVLHAGEGSRGSDSDGKSRLLREAQALAKLSDPNVVAVFDVGTHGGDVWLAMELVDGETLKAWTRSRARRWADALDVFEQAGAGLSHAHRSGLVHRDFKPDNVMIGRDGRVRVMDFGLVRASAASRQPRASGPERAPDDPLDLSLTNEGAIMGTPAYMAPEQFDGKEVDARADQFAFCVSLWEALYGQRPFAGDSFTALATAVLEGRRRPPPRDRRVPAWLRSALERGLARRPEARWPSMDALLTALRAGRMRRRRRVVLASVLLVGGAVAGLGVAARARQIAAHEHCAAQGRAIESMWPGQRDVLAQAARSSPLPYARESVERVFATLDVWAASWRDSRDTACQRATLQHVWNADLRDRADACLDLERARVESLIELLAGGDEAALQQAVAIAARLPSPTRCLQEATLEAEEWPDAEQRTAVGALRKELRRAALLESAGHYEEGVAAAQHAQQSAVRLGWPPLVAESEAVLGALLIRAGRFEDAERTLETAYVDALAAGSDAVAIQAAGSLSFLTGFKLARVDDGLRWADHALALSRRHDDADPLQRASILNGRAAALYLASQLEPAEALYREVLDLRVRLLGEEHPDVATSHNNLASVAFARGDLEAAQRHYGQAIDIATRTLGSDHPERIESLSNLAAVYFEHGDVARAAELDREVLTARERALGPDHPDVAAALSSLAGSLRATGDGAQARTLERRALVIREASLGADHPDLIPTLVNLAELAVDAGDLAEAEEWLARSVAIATISLGATHPQRAFSLGRQAAVADQRGDIVRARALYIEAYEILAADPTQRAEDLGWVCAWLAALEGKDGDQAAARMWAARAADAFGDSGAPPPVHALIGPWLDAPP